MATELSSVRTPSLQSRCACFSALLVLGCFANSHPQPQGILTGLTASSSTTTSRTSIDALYELFTAPALSLALMSAPSAITADDVKLAAELKNPYNKALGCMEAGPWSDGSSANNFVLNKEEEDQVRNRLFCSTPAENKSTAFILLGDSTLRNKYAFAIGKDWKDKSLENQCSALQCDDSRRYYSVCYGKVEVADVTRTRKLYEQLLGELEGFHHIVVVLNFGLHHLHFYPLRPKFLNETLNHEVLLSEIFDSLTGAPVDQPQSKYYKYKLLRQQQPADVTTKVVYKLTNSICTSLYNKDFKAQLSRWDRTEKARCANVCSSRLGISTSEAMEYCERYYFDDKGVQNMNLAANRVLENFPQIGIMDDYNFTKGHCSCSKPGDGRHYAHLVPIWWHRLQAFVETHLR